jgi:hypothetical protein
VELTAGHPAEMQIMYGLAGERRRYFRCRASAYIGRDRTQLARAACMPPPAYLRNENASLGAQTRVLLRSAVIEAADQRRAAGIFEPHVRVG